MTDRGTQSTGRFGGGEEPVVDGDTKEQDLEGTLMDGMCKGEKCQERRGGFGIKTDQMQAGETAQWVKCLQAGGPQLVKPHRTACAYDPSPGDSETGGSLRLIGPESSCISKLPVPLEDL